MAKKSRKGRARRAPKMYPKGAPTSSSVKIEQTAERATKEVQREEPSVMTGDELREEYWYVYNDLKRIAVVASVLLAVLIALSFVI